MLWGFLRHQKPLVPLPHLRNAQMGPQQADLSPGWISCDPSAGGADKLAWKTQDQGLPPQRAAQGTGLTRDCSYTHLWSIGINRGTTAACMEAISSESLAADLGRERRTVPSLPGFGKGAQRPRSGEVGPI